MYETSSCFRSSLIVVCSFSSSNKHEEDLIMVFILISLVTKDRDLLLYRPVIHPLSWSVCSSLLPIFNCSVFIIDYFYVIWMLMHQPTYLHMWSIFMPLVDEKKSLPKWFAYPQIDSVKYQYLCLGISHQSQSQSRCCYHLRVIIICRCYIWYL